MMVLKVHRPYYDSDFRATAGNVRDRTIISLALGTGLRLAEIVGLDVGNVFAPDGAPRVRVRVRAAIAKGGRAADVFLRGLEC